MAIKHVMRYLAGKPQGIRFTQSEPVDPIAYSDSDWGGDTDDRMSSMGYVRALVEEEGHSSAETSLSLSLSLSLPPSLSCVCVCA